MQEINKLAREWYPNTVQNRLVVLTAPEKAGLTIPDQAKLAALEALHQLLVLCEVRVEHLEHDAAVEETYRQLIAKAATTAPAKAKKVARTQAA